MGIIKETIRYYKKLKEEEKEKKTLINEKTDFSLLGKLIRKCNQDPNLKVEIFMKDGTRILLRSYEEEKNTASLFTGDYLPVE